MGEQTVRWTIVVDKATDVDLRTYLAGQGMKKGDLSKFVQETVRRRLLRETINEFRTGFADLSAEETDALVDEAVAWAREGRKA